MKHIPRRITGFVSLVFGLATFLAFALPIWTPLMQRYTTIPVLIPSLVTFILWLAFSVTGFIGMIIDQEKINLTGIALILGILAIIIGVITPIPAGVSLTLTSQQSFLFAVFVIPWLIIQFIDGA